MPPIRSRRGDESFQKASKKIGRLAWTTEDAKQYLDPDAETYIQVNRPTFDDRMNALYTDFDGKTVIKPEELINREDAQGIIHTVKVAIRRVIEATEYWGHQIGTKGFMK